MNFIRYSRALRAPRRALPLAARSQVRHFHPTKPAQLINEALDASAGLIHGVHSITYLPWVASIPLTALLVRMFVGLPTQLFTKIHTRRERDMGPLVQSWAHFHNSMSQRGNHNFATAINARQDAARKTTAVVERLRKQRGVWKIARFTPILQLPVFISLMESLRGMCGNTSGLVPWLLSLIEPTQESLDTAIKALHLTVEPTLANEGALWFPDLLAGDPTGVLPALVAASIILNVRTGWKTTSREELLDMPKLDMYRSITFNGLRVFIQVLALNVGLSGWYYEMPAALMIYWISSTNIATLQSWILEKKMSSRSASPTFSKRYVSFEKPGVSDPFFTKLR